MITLKELVTVILIGIILGFTWGFFINKTMTFSIFFYAFLIVLLTLAINLISKKIMAYYLESKIETKIWGIKHFGFKPHQHFEREIPAGVFLPLLVVFATLGAIPWLASLTFDVKPKTYRSAKRHGLYSFTEMTEYDIGLIAAAGVFANLIAAFIFYFLGRGDISEINIFFAAFSTLIPISDLDGSKILFGSIILWSFVAVLTLIGLGYAILMP